MFAFRRPPLVPAFLSEHMQREHRRDPRRTQPTEEAGGGFGILTPRVKKSRSRYGLLSLTGNLRFVPGGAHLAVSACELACSPYDRFETAAFPA
jgi:hypothetical protein